MGSSKSGIPRLSKKHEVEILDGYAQLIVERKNGERIAVKIDIDDIERVLAYRWCARWDEDIQSYYIAHHYRVDGKGNSMGLSRFVIGEDDKKIKVDHINHDTLDNRKSRLRRTTNQENTMNKKGANRNNVGSGLRNVYKNKGKWRAALGFHGKKINLGNFSNKEDAYKVAQKFLATHCAVPVESLA